MARATIYLKEETLVVLDTIRGNTPRSKLLNNMLEYLLKPENQDYIKSICRVN